MTLYVGLDVHRGGFQVALLPSASVQEGIWTGGQVEYLRFANTQRDFSLLKQAIDARVCEAEPVLISVDLTGGYYSAPIVHFLDRLGYPVFSLDTHEVKRIREGLLQYQNKTDRIDAFSLAFILHLKKSGILLRKAVPLNPSADAQSTVLMSLVRLRWQHVKLKTQSTNRLRQLLLASFPEAEAECFSSIVRVLPYYPTREEILQNSHLEQVPYLRKAIREKIVNLARDSVGVTGGIYKEAIYSWASVRQDTSARIKALTEKIGAEVRHHPCGPILLSFPGIADIIAATLIGTIREIRRWPNPNTLRKALGVYGVVAQSGATIGRVKPGKGGNREAKRALFQAVIVCISSRNPGPNDIRDYYLRQVTRGKPKIKAVYSSMSKLVDLMYHCLTVGEPYRYMGRYRHPPP